MKNEGLVAAVLLTRGWLARQPDPFRHTVLSRGRTLELVRRVPVYAQDDPPGGIYGIIRGAASVNIAPGPTGPHLGHIAAPGDWFGEAPFFTGGSRMMRLETTEDSLLFHLPLDEMERMASDDPQNIRRFAQIALINLEIAFQTVNDLLIPDPDARIAAVLARIYGTGTGGPVRMSQTDLGEMTNTSRKTVNRALARFQTLGLLRTGYSAVEVLDAPGLLCFAYGQ